MRKLLQKVFGLLATVLFLGSVNAKAQTPALSWQKIYGDAIQRERCNASVRLGPNLYVHGGRNYVPSTNTLFPFLLFTNANGDSLNTLYYPFFPVGTIYGLAANEDGTFVACGTYSVGPTTGAIFLLKFNQQGGIIWHQNFSIGSAGNRQQVIRVPDGYLIVADVLVQIIKTDLNGNLLWQKAYGAPQGSGQNITPLPDGSYLVTGLTTKNSPTTVSGFHQINNWLLKLRPNGDTIFTKVLGNPTNFEISYAAAPTADGGLAVAGAYVANVPQTKRQGQLLKLDSLLNLQWEMKVMPNGGDYEAGCEFFALQPTVSGEYVMAGMNYQSPTGGKGYIARISPPVPGVPAFVNWSSFREIGYFNDMLYENDGSAVFGGISGYFNNSNIQAAKFLNLGQPYKPNYCASPPQSQFTYLVRPDSLVFTQASLSGLRYGVISKWEYLFGDDSTFVTYNPEQAKRVSHFYQPQHRVSGTKVKLVVTNNLFCTDTLTLYPFGDGPTGITEATAQQVEVKIWPQPMEQETMLELKNFPKNEKLHLEITDMVGRKAQIQQQQIKPGQWNLQRKIMPAGLYLYRIVSATNVVAQGKLLVQ